MLTPALSIFYTQAGAVRARRHAVNRSAPTPTASAAARVSALWCCGDSKTRVADRQPIHSIIVGSATNQDGKSSGITAPNRWAQVQGDAACARPGRRPPPVTSRSSKPTAPERCSATSSRPTRSVTSIGPDVTARCLLGSIKGNIGHARRRSRHRRADQGRPLPCPVAILPPTVAAAGPNPRACIWKPGVCTLATAPVPTSGRNGFVAGRCQLVRPRRQQRPRRPDRPSRRR